MSSESSVKDPVVTTAAEAILEGKLVAIPTETVYGLGCDATNAAAVQRVYTAKGRPSNNPLILHFDSLRSALPYIAFDAFADPTLGRRRLEILSNKFWPGPLSVVVPRGPGISDHACGCGNSIAIRIPDHPLTLQILELVKRPVAAPSANPSAYISPTTAHHVTTSLGNAVDLVVDGGPCSIGIESTVLSLLGPSPTLLRPGCITVDVLEEALGTPISRIAAHHTTTSQPALLSPGMLAKHYSPKTPVALLPALTPTTPLPPRRGIILFSNRSLPGYFTETRVLSDSGDLVEVASKLFACLREMDQLDLGVIVVDTCEPKGLGLAIMDRLLRASSE